MHNAKRQLKGDEVKKTARGLPQVMSLTSTQSWLRDLPSPKAGLSPAPKMGLRPPLRQKENPRGSSRAPGWGWVSLTWGKRPPLPAGTAVTPMQKEGVLAGNRACRSGKLVAVFFC